jgi:hypothetical protein
VADLPVDAFDDFVAELVFAWAASSFTDEANEWYAHLKK